MIRGGFIAFAPPAKEGQKGLIAFVSPAVANIYYKIYPLKIYRFVDFPTFLKCDDEGGLDEPRP